MVKLTRTNNLITGSVQCPHCKASQTFTEGSNASAVLVGEGTRENTRTSGEKFYERILTFDLTYQCSECSYTVPGHGEYIEEIDHHAL